MNEEIGLRETTLPVIISISSGKGGVGKTSLAVNASFALAAAGKRCLLVDGDLGLANIDVLLGLTVRVTVRDVMAGLADPLSVIVYPRPDLGVLPASSGVPDMVNLGPEEQRQIGDVLNELMHGFDCVIIDTAAGIGPSVLWFNAFSKKNMVIFTPDPTSFTDAYALIKVLHREYGMQDFYLISNFVKDEGEGLQIYEGFSKVIKRFLGVNTHYVGHVPRDSLVAKAVKEQRPFYETAPDSKAAKAIRAIASVLASWTAGTEKGAG
ncbi:MAG: MinD/ParA family protein [Dissulfurimicrobium sp.]|uniref:MinD/ParA family protein n=1 Tax=Dissulfurimicrobium TaxID=1769732 RepID=UPI001EDA052F|nr:MinD/ParA family protein [Dissulfurimicrobium hydrothermale]UKL13956.1 MinD/ParA family protein [Dissulfurimicrobium hydrothermale]